MEENALPRSHDGGHSMRPSLTSLFLTFLKIGSTAFGGFMALISVVVTYAVERKKMLSQEDMLDGVSLASILPGPVAVNVVAYVGYRVRGIPGAIVTGVGVLLPSFVFVLALSYFYFQFGGMPTVSKFFLGLVPAVAAVIFSAAWNMASKALQGAPEGIIAASALLILSAVPGFWISLSIIAASALAGKLLFKTACPASAQGEAGRGKADVGDERPVMTSAPGVGIIPASLAFAGFSAPLLVKIFTTFAGMSLFLFGGGYVFIPLIRQIVVEGNGWVTGQEFIDGIALGQVTPGPILISAAFIGYKAAGLAGATAATIGIFAPPAVLMLFSARFLDRIKRSASIKAVLRGVRPAVIGMIAAAGIAVIKTAAPEIISVLIFGAALAALLKWKVETAWVIPVAGVTGLLWY